LSDEFADTKFITNPEEVQKELEKDPNHKEIMIETDDKQKLSCSFLNRQKIRS